MTDEINYKTVAEALKKIGFTIHYSPRTVTVIYPGAEHDPHWYYWKNEPLIMHLTKHAQERVPIHDWIAAVFAANLKRFEEVIPDPSKPTTDPLVETFEKLLPEPVKEEKKVDDDEWNMPPW